MPAIATTLAHARLIERLTPAVRDAGHLIEQMKADGLTRQTKADNSIVTDADMAAEKLLTAAILAVDPGATIIAEEAVASGHMPAPGDRFWLVDPLDGTRGFVGGRPDYAVCVGLIEQGIPTLGLILHPPTQTLWSGSTDLGAWREDGDSGADNRGNRRQPIRTRKAATPLAIATSHSHLDPRTKAWISKIPDTVVSPSSSALKFCLLAEGTQDAYPRHGPTCEWDTAAGDAILRAAGGAVLGTDGQALRYAKPDFLNGPFLAVGDPQLPTTLPPLPA